MVASQNNCESVSENATIFYEYLLFSVVGLKITKCYSKEWRMNIHLHTQVTLESLSVLLRTSIRHAKLYLI